MCSYIWCGSSGLRRVPALRADIFRDRSLSLADKRALMSTITACMEAYEQGSGCLVVRGIFVIVIDVQYFSDSIT